VRIAYADLITTQGHRTFNENIVNALRAYGFDVTTISSANAFPKDFCVDVVIPTRFFNLSDKSIPFLARKKMEWERVRWVLEYLKREGPWDFVVIGAFETLSFAYWSRWFLRASPVFAFLHYNVDDSLLNPLKNFTFRSIDGGVNFLVLEPFIGDYLMQFSRRHKVFWVPQIIQCRTCFESMFFGDGLKIIFAPSGSNSPELLPLAMSIESELSARGILLVAKGDREYVSDSIVVKKYFCDLEYENYLMGSSAVLVAFEKSFNYRVSGVVYEALSVNKPVIATKCRFSEYMKHKYGNPVFLLESLSAASLLEGMDLISSVGDFDWKQEAFCEDHSYDTFLKNFLEAVNVTV